VGTDTAAIPVNATPAVIAAAGAAPIDPAAAIAAPAIATTVAPTATAVAPTTAAAIAPTATAAAAPATTVPLANIYPGAAVAAGAHGAMIDDSQDTRYYVITIGHVIGVYNSWYEFFLYTNNISHSIYAGATPPFRLTASLFVHMV
ncbi:hypothetical protein H0H87_010838, partial [Tephrocybe sp. NHM501043]